MKNKTKSALTFGFLILVLIGLSVYAAFDNYVGGYSGQHQNANENIEDKK